MPELMFDHYTSDLFLESPALLHKLSVLGYDKGFQPFVSFKLVFLTQDTFLVDNKTN